MTLDYFYGQAGELFAFYRIPKALFQEPRFQSLSTDAKTLYGILLDRMSLSVKNGWLDEQSRVFIIFTIEDVKRTLCCADNKAMKLFRELEKFGLVERKRRGLGKPSLVYVKNFSSDLSNERVQNRENHESGAFKKECQDPPKSRCNKNKKNKTERNNTNPILSDESKMMKNRELLEEYFSHSLEIDLLLRLYPDDEDTIYQIVNLLVDTCDSKRKLIRIAGDDKPAEVVCSRLKKLNTMSREKVMKQVLENAKREYDYILIDCTPSLGMLTVNALAAADSALIPVQAQYLSAKGLEQLLQTVQKVRRQINPKLKIEGILLTMTDSRTIYGQQISNLIRQAYGKHLKVFDQTIPRSVRAAETSTTGKSIFQYDPKGKVAEAYHSIAKGVLADAEKRLKRQFEQLR